VSLGMCLTSLKKVCRQHGIKRWPHRRLVSIDKKIQNLETSLVAPPMVSAETHEAGLKRQIDQLHSERASLPQNYGANHSITPLAGVIISSQTSGSSIADSLDLGTSCPSTPNSEVPFRTDTPPAASLSASPASLPAGASSRRRNCGAADSDETYSLSSEIPTPPASSSGMPFPDVSAAAAPQHGDALGGEAVNKLEGYPGGPGLRCQARGAYERALAVCEENVGDVEEDDHGLISALVGCAAEKAEKTIELENAFGCIVQSKNLAGSKAATHKGVCRSEDAEPMGIGREMAGSRGQGSVKLASGGAAGGGLMSVVDEGDVFSKGVDGVSVEGVGDGGMTDEEIAAALAGCAGGGEERLGGLADEESFGVDCPGMGVWYEADAVTDEDGIAQGVGIVDMASADDLGNLFA
jgi:hypothetical protein